MSDPFVELLGMKPRPSELQPIPTLEFAQSLVRECSRKVTPGHGMDWSHTIRNKRSGKEYRVSITLEEQDQ